MVSVRNLSKSFGDNVVLDDISLEVSDGEIVAIMGSSGGGKTTLLRCISGLIPPSSGIVHVAGIDVQEKPEEARKAMGMVFQSAALFDSLSVEENVIFGLRRVRHIPEDEEDEVVAEILEMVGLKGTNDLMPSELSGGMRKRVGIARALALKPKVMLYDEPTTGLDPITTYTIDKLIVDVSRQFGVTSLVVSHDVSSVFRTSARIAFLEAGKLSFIGSPEEFERASSQAIQELLKKSTATTLD